MIVSFVEGVMIVDFYILIGLILAYNVFYAFRFYQLRYWKYYATPAAIILPLFVILSTAFKYGFLIYLGYKTIWYYPFILWIIGGVSGFFSAGWDVPDEALAHWGFLVIPISIIFMIYFFQKGFHFVV